MYRCVLCVARRVGLDVVCSETVMNPLQMYIDDSDCSPPEGGVTVAASHDDEMRFLLTVR